MDNEDIIDITLDCIDTSCRNEKVDIETKFQYFNPYILFIFTLLIFVFCIQIYYGFPDKIDLNNFTYKYSNYRQGNIYGIFTSMFLHGSVEHIVGNLIFFYIFALISYRLVGFFKSIAIYVVTGLGAGILSYLFNNNPSLGASGALFGIFGFFTPFFFIYKNKLTDNLLDIAWTFVVMAVIQIISGLTVEYIDNYAHLGGYITGLLLGYYYFSSEYFQLNNSGIKGNKIQKINL